MADHAQIPRRAAHASPRTRGGSVLVRVRGPVPSAADLLRELLLALAEDPPALVCDLSGVAGPAHPRVLEALLALRRQALLWPGTPVAVVCPAPDARAALAEASLVVTESLHPALVAVRALAPQEVARVQLPPHPVAARAARDFLTRTCEGWELPSAVDPGRLAVSELVTGAMAGCTTAVDVSLRRAGDRLAISVRGGAPAAPAAQDAAPAPAPAAPGLPGGCPGPVVEALCRATGVLRTDDGRTVTWAVLRD